MQSFFGPNPISQWLRIYPDYAEFPTKLLDILTDLLRPLVRDIFVSPYNSIELIACFVADDRGVLGIGNPGVLIDMSQEMSNIIFEIADYSLVGIEL